jgi:hypothetical protein
MLMAYEDCGFRDIPTEETRVPLHPIESFSDAQRMLDEAKKQLPNVQWVIKGTGPYGVHGKL